jgi:hypothetical protein
MDCQGTVVIWLRLREAGNSAVARLSGNESNAMRSQGILPGEFNEPPQANQPIPSFFVVSNGDPAEVC